jgi:CTP synthase (UTP-ammonia lyase)
MNRLVGVVGDFHARNRTHLATNSALQHAGLQFDWVSTADLDGEPERRLARYDGVWIAPASPYRSMDGALGAIRHARERGVPLVGT